MHDSNKKPRPVQKTARPDRVRRIKCGGGYRIIRKALPGG